MTASLWFASRKHRGCLPDGGARGEGFALNEVPHPCCVLNLTAKVWFFFEMAIASVYEDWQYILCVLCNKASIELLDREDHVPIFAPDYVAVLDGELFEVLWLDVAVVLRVWMCKDEWLEIHSLGRAVAEEDVKAHVSSIFSSYDVKSCGFHWLFYADLK